MKEMERDRHFANARGRKFQIRIVFEDNIATEWLDNYPPYAICVFNYLEKPLLIHLVILT